MSAILDFLDNWLENKGAIDISDTNKQIYLKISSDAYKYIFHLKNTIDDSVLKKNPALKTTKKEKSSHGYGTKIIRDIARKYHGKCDFYEEDEFFCCSVTLKK